MSINDTFAALRQSLNKQYMDGYWGRQWQSTLGQAMDESINRLVQARVARLPTFCPEDALQYIASERQLERAFSESISDYREVLRTAWSVWARGGSAGAHTNALGREGFGAVTVVRRHDFQGVPPDNAYVRAFHNDVWAQFDVVCSKPLPWYETFWDSTQTWGSGVWGISAQPSEVDQMKRFMRLFRAGHDTPMFVYLSFCSGTLWGLGTWGQGIWGGEGDVVRILVGEDHWGPRGLT